MSNFPNSPRLIKGGVVMLNPDTSTVRQTVASQYDPDTLKGRLQIRMLETGMQ